MDISAWWSTIPTLEKAYWLIAIPASIAFLIILAMTIFGGEVDSDIDGDADASIEGDEGIGFQFITVKNLIAFFTIMSWTGIACSSGGLTPMYTIIISVLAGLAMMTIMATIYYLMGKLTESGTMKPTSAIGSIGETYLRIPPNKEGFGKVQIQIQGALRTLDAMTNDSEEIKTGSIIKVVDVIDEHILLVTITSKTKNN